MSRSWPIRPLALLLFLGLVPHAVSAAEVTTENRDAGVDPDAPGAPAPLITPPPAPVTVTAHARAAARVLSDPLASPRMEELGTEARAEILFSGRILPVLGWQMGIVGLYGNGRVPGDSRLALLDAIGKLELGAAFNVWIGQMPIVSDRASLGTYATYLAWTPLGAFSQLVGPIGLRRGSDLRGTGAVAWGHRGRFAYHLGAYDPKTLGNGPLVTGRLAVTTTGEESGFYRPSSYYGSKPLFAVAAFAQFQRNGSLGALVPDDYLAIGGDLFAETGGDQTGVLDWEASLTRFWGGNEPLDYFASSQFSYLVPLEIGTGRFQPVGRVQYGHTKQAETLLLFDGQLGYVLAGPRARVLGMYQYGKLPNGAINIVLVGLQMATN